MTCVHTVILGGLIRDGRNLSRAAGQMSNSSFQKLSVSLSASCSSFLGTAGWCERFCCLPQMLLWVGLSILILQIISKIFIFMWAILALIPSVILPFIRTYSSITPFRISAERGSMIPSINKYWTATRAASRSSQCAQSIHGTFLPPISAEQYPDLNLNCAVCKNKQSFFHPILKKPFFL